MGGLTPVLIQKNLPRNPRVIKAWAETLTEELKTALNRIFPLRDNEFDFISTMRQWGKIDASILTNNLELQSIVNHHPALRWAIKRDN